MKENETGFICDWEFFMRNQCEKCPIRRLCDEFEEENKIPSTNREKEYITDRTDKKQI